MAAIARHGSLRSLRMLNIVGLKQTNRAASTANNDTTAVDNQITHTGQKFDDTDYRLARFTSRPKEVNQRFAIDLIAEIPPNPINSSSTFCDGGGGPLGHPKVYINVDKPGNHICGYCGLRFYKDDHKHH